MKTEFPTYALKGTTFLVDIDKMELREKANPANVLYFSKMIDRRTHYEFGYDPLKKTWMRRQLSAGGDVPGNYAILPQMKDLDPQGMAEKYGKTIAEISVSCDYELQVGQYPFRERLEKGRLPVIDIAGHPFSANMYLGKLHPQGGLLRDGISMDDVFEHHLVHTFFYHIPTQKEYQLPEGETAGMTSLPKDVVLVMLPGPARLDPVGLAIRHGVPLDTYTKKYPLIMYHKATVIPLAFTPLAEQVKFRRAKIDLKHLLSQEIPGAEKKTKPRIKRTP
jgi:hypothetical protein